MADDKVQAEFTKFDNIAAAAERALLDAGFKMLNIAFTARPKKDDESPRHVEMVIQYDPEAEREKPEIEVQVTNAMDEQLTESHRKQLEEQAKKAREELGDLFRDGKRGFLD